MVPTSMSMSNILSYRKRPKSDHDNQKATSFPNNNGASNTIVGRKRGSVITYQLAFCLGVLLIQLARVHAWSPTLSSSSIAKKSTPTAAIQIPRDPAGSSDALFWTSFPDRPSIPSCELLSSRYLIHDPKSNSNNNLLKMVVSPSGSHRPYAPSMLLRDDFFFPITKNSLSSAESVQRSNSDGSNSMQAADGLLSLSPNNKRDGRVLGFDVFELHAKRSEQSAASSEETSHQIPAPAARATSIPNDPEAFFSAPGLTWKNSPLSSTSANANVNANDEGGGVGDASSSSSTATTTASGNGQRSNNNGGVQVLRYTSPLLPAWFPWIPTKSQIMTLKLKELKEACSQRGLTKTGNKDVLQERLWGWTIEHQMQHQARLSGDFLSSWFEHDDSDDPNSYLLERDRHQEEQDRNEKHAAETAKEKENNDTPNSLAEWSRSIDTEKLTQKRQEIHRQKRVGKKPNTPLTGNNKSKNNNYKNKTKHIAATKEYLTKLSNAMKTAPSSPYASNRDVRELYDASKKADQLGEPLLAIELLESLVKLTPNDARIYRRLSRMHNDQGNIDVARATLQDGLRKLPHNPWLWHGMGSLEQSQGRTDYATRCYQRAIQEDPAFAHSYHAWGIHEFNNGQIAKAMKILKKGIEYCPTNHRLHHALGDLYRGAKLPKDAERSYRRALEEGPPVSHSFALSALASVAYEQGSVDEARQWLYQSIETNNGRHAQGWLALAEIEEAEGNMEEARKVCEAAIIRYEKGLVEARERYKRDSNLMNHQSHGKKNYSNPNKHDQNRNRGDGERLDIDKPYMDPTKSEEVERGLLHWIPKYRSGDKFLAVFRHWARLEGRYGTFDRCNKIYDRASKAFPLEYKISLDWARFHANIKSHEARKHFVEACSRASTKDAEPYREYASFEMSLGEYDQARKILFRGAQAVARSPDGGTGKQNQQELARLYVTWAVCEWHLRNIPRVEVLFDHALRLTEVGSDEGSELRSFVLFCIAQLEYYEREELHLAQHCVGLCLKENSLPGGNAPIWSLWAKISRGLKNSRLEEKCVNETERCHMLLEDLKEEDQEDGSSALDTMNMLKGSQNIQNMMRQEPWFDKLHAVRISLGGKESAMTSSSKFYSSINIPNFENHELQSETIEDVQVERQREEVPVMSSEGQMS